MIDGFILALIAAMYAAARHYTPDASPAVADRLGGGVLEVLLLYVFSVAFRALYFAVKRKPARGYYMVAILFVCIVLIARWAPTLEQAIMGVASVYYQRIYSALQWSAPLLAGFALFWISRRQSNRS